MQETLAAYGSRRSTTSCEQEKRSTDVAWTAVVRSASAVKRRPAGDMVGEKGFLKTDERTGFRSVGDRGIRCAM